jgi:alpha-1,3-rhamnosyl/mannosyltransferase
MRVGVNLLYLKPGVVGGSEVYATRILGAVDAARPRGVDLVLVVNRRFPAAHPDLASAFPIVVAPISGDRPPQRIAVETAWLPRALARRSVDLVHHVANTIPYRHPGRAVVTIHDLLPFLRPEDVGRIKGAYLRERIDAAVRHAAVVITPSGYVRDLVVERYTADPARVIVLPAPTPVAVVDGATAPPVDAPYFLYPAITHPHKNHIVLLRALAALARRRPDVSLVLTGGAGAAEDEVVAEIDRLGIADRVRRTGRVSRADLDALYRGAVATTFPSRHEGYGLPVSEAMAWGSPVVASNVTALPEVVGDAGILLGPDDVDAWAGTMERLLDDRSLRASLAERGPSRAASPTADQVAERLADAYRLAAGR